MGCDIHVHVEIKVNGEWLHYNHPSVSRDYDLFAKMAGVRNGDGIEPIAEPRGFLTDATRTTCYDRAKWGDDGHSDSYLNAKELAELESWYDARHPESIPGLNGQFGYLFGNGFGDFINYPDNRPPGLQDVRIVFWFDN